MGYFFPNNSSPSTIRALIKLNENTGNQEASSLRDIGDFILSFFLVFAIWIFFFGWRPGLLFSLSDGLQYDYPVVQLLREQLLRNIYYDPSWLGGTKISSVWVNPWFLSAALRLKVSTANSIFFTLVFPQVLLAFSALQLFCALGNYVRLPLLRRTLLLVLFAFPPFLAWRILAGHFYYPSLLTIAASALFAGLARGRLSLAAAAILITALAATGESVAYQQSISAVILLVPIVAVIAWKLRPTKLVWLLFFGAGVASVLWSLKDQIEMLAHFTSADASRYEKGREIVYSFAVSSWRDWMGSLFWGRDIFPSGRNLSLLMETNFAFGPLLFLLAARYRNNACRGLCWVFFLLLIAVVSLASDISPLSDLILWIAYPLQYFRVPMRSLVPLIFFLAPLALLSFGAVPLRGPSIRLPIRITAAFILLVLAYFLPPALREVVAWCLVAGFFSERLISALGTEVSLAPLALIALMAFGQRLPTPKDFRKTPENVAALRSRILKLSPALADPLNRATFDFQDDKFHANTAHVLGISSLDGYWQPLRQYNEITSRAYGVAVNPFMLNFRISNSDPGSAELYRLYNVRYRLHLYPDGELKSLPTDSGGRRAWLLESQTDLPCKTGNVSEVRVLDPFFSAEVNLGKSENSCRLVLPMNFARNLRAYSGGKRLVTESAQGGLFGVALPPGTTKVFIQAEALAPSWLAASPYLAVLVALLTLAVWGSRLRLPPYLRR